MPPRMSNLWGCSMKVEFGNDHAIEQYRDPASDDPGLVRKRDDPGQKITTLIIPDEQGLMEAFTSVVGIMGRHHLKEGTVPNWVKSSNKTLEQMLMDHYEIKNVKPRAWGKPKSKKK